VANLLERAISTDDADRAAKIIQSALDIESDEVANYCFPENVAATQVAEGRLRFRGERCIWPISRTCSRAHPAQKNTPSNLTCSGLL
jgi:hypothetical protein